MSPFCGFRGFFKFELRTKVSSVRNRWICDRRDGGACFPAAMPQLLPYEGDTDADGLLEAEGDWLADGLLEAEADGLTDGLTLLLGETDLLRDADGDLEAEALGDLDGDALTPALFSSSSTLASRTATRSSSSLNLHCHAMMLSS